MPAGVIVPIIGGHRAPDGSEAWLVMADVSADLAAYPRLGLTGAAATARARQILARLARFHAYWEQPDQQARLRAQAWLGHTETPLWDPARTDALATGGAPVDPRPLGDDGPPPPADLSADLAAFLDQRPADERSWWSARLVDRQPLVDALAGLPTTLIHNDLDDRNIGLRWFDHDPLPALVLIDWEWMTIGPAALDVAKLVGMLPAIIAPGAPVPEIVWTDALADEYFAQYRAAGGRVIDSVAWRRAYGLARIAHGLAQLPTIYGHFLRVARGDAPPPQVAGVPAEIVRQGVRDALLAMERASDAVIREARRWLE
jgi:hypothetical protein